MVVKGGVPTVGHWPLPEDVYGPADAKTIGEYAAVLPVGWTVAANDTDEDKAMQAEYSGAAFATELTPRDVVTWCNNSGSATYDDIPSRVIFTGNAMGASPEGFFDGWGHWRAYPNQPALWSEVEGDFETWDSAG